MRCSSTVQRVETLQRGNSFCEIVGTLDVGRRTSARFFLLFAVLDLQHGLSGRLVSKKKKGIGTIDVEIYVS